MLKELHNGDVLMMDKDYEGWPYWIIVTDNTPRPWIRTTINAICIVPDDDTKYFCFTQREPNELYDLAFVLKHYMRFETIEEQYG